MTSKSGDIIWAYAARKGPLSRGGGKQCVAEACAKNLNDMRQDNKLEKLILVVRHVLFLISAANPISAVAASNIDPGSGTGAIK